MPRMNSQTASEVADYVSMEDWAMSTMTSTDLLTDFDLSSVLRNFQQCYYIWGYVASNNAVPYVALVRRCAEDLDVSERWARELIHRLRDDLFLLPADIGQPVLTLKSSSAFAWLVDAAMKFRNEMPVLTADKSGFGMTLLLDTAVFEGISLSMSELRTGDADYYSVSESTWKRALRSLQALHLVEKTSPHGTLRCTSRGRALARKLCMACFVAVAEEMM